MQRGVIFCLIFFNTLSAFSQQVVINEVLTSPPARDTLYNSNIDSVQNTNSLYNLNSMAQPSHNREWIELFNTHSCDTADISCFVLGSNMYKLGEPNWGALTFPSGTKIPPLGFIIVGGGDAQSPFVDFNLKEIRDTAFGTLLEGDAVRWFLRDDYGWIALYDTSGTAVDAIYWSQGNQSDLNTREEYAHKITIDHSCYIDTFSSAKEISTIQYVGASRSKSYYSFKRQRDGKAWLVGPQQATPRNCNSICIEPPKLTIEYRHSCYTDHNGFISVQTSDGGTSPYHFLWSNADTTNSIYHLEQGVYSVVVSDKYNCLKVYDTFYIVHPPPIFFNVDTSSDICNNALGKAIVHPYNSYAPYSFEWNTSPSQYDSIATQLASEQYEVVITDSAGCKDTAVAAIGNIDFIIQTTVHFVDDWCERSGAYIRLSPSGGTLPYTFQWDGSAPSTEAAHENLGAGTYVIYIADSNYCRDTISVTIQGIPCEINVPNIITPNNDGINDKLVIKNLEFYPGNKLVIYNRYGKKIAEFSDYQNNWDGSKRDGAKEAEGVYYYVLQLSDGHNFKGSITIMR